MGLFDSFFKKKNSADEAKDRLKLLLVSDRSNCSPETMELIKNDIIKVISKYMEIDAQGLDIPDHPKRRGTHRTGSVCEYPDPGNEKEKIDME